MDTVDNIIIKIVSFPRIPEHGHSLSVVSTRGLRTDARASHRNLGPHFSFAKPSTMADGLVVIYRSKHFTAISCPSMTMEMIIKDMNWTIKIKKKMF
jgi:hypothetical protein